MSDQTATERLRELLDERGVKWETDRSGLRVMWGKPIDVFHDTMQYKAVDNALPNGGLNVHICGWTPEQAIAATLGNDEIDELKDDYCTLVRENKRLHSCLSDDAENARLIMGENVKLRKLVLDMWGSGYPDRSCEGCDLYDECYDSTERLKRDGRERCTRCLFELRIEDRMRELGIEVVEHEHD